MRVNTGQVRFYEDSDDDDDKPNHTWDIKRLFQEALEQDTFYDEDDKRLKKKNYSKNIIYKKMQQVFMEGTKDRITAADYAGNEGLELNVFEDYEEEMKQRNSFIDQFSIAKSSFMKSLISSISLLDDELWKKALLVYSYKPMIKCGDAFRLLTEFSKDQVGDLSKDEIKKLVEINKKINNYIIEAQEDYNVSRSNIIETFFENVKKLALKGYEDDFENMLREEFDYILTQSNASNIWKKVYGYGTNGDGWRIDREDKNSPGILAKSNQKEFREMVIKVKNDLALLLDNPNMSTLYKRFDISRNLYIKHIGSVIQWVFENWDI